VTQGAAGMIHAAGKDLSAAVAKHDLAAIVEMYADDAEMIPPNDPPVKGKPAIGDRWRGALDAGVTSFELTPDSTTVDGDTADERGAYAMKLSSGEIFQSGKYHVIWTRAHGVWKMQRNEWTIEGSRALADLRTS